MVFDLEQSLVYMDGVLCQLGMAGQCYNCLHYIIRRMAPPVTVQEQLCGRPTGSMKVLKIIVKSEL